MYGISIGDMSIVLGMFVVDVAVLAYRTSNRRLQICPIVVKYAQPQCDYSKF
jgi:hypothetical protein